MTISASEDFDLIVSGGGPAGSTMAALVAMAGHRVLLLERERFPRYQIGESLLPSTVHGIGAMLGIRDQLAQAGFMQKRGGTFRWGANPEPWTFSFGSSTVISDGVDYAYQVERSKFDKILLRNAARKGVDVREGSSVTGLIQDGDRVSGVEFLDDQGRARSARARFVADASGNRSITASHVGSREYSKFFQNFALFCYFENGKRLPAPNSGNILCAAFPEGWFWYIPLSATLTSVGAVIAKEHSHLLQGGYEPAMQRFIASCPLIADYLSGAARVTEGQYGQFRVRQDYSYTTSRFWAPGCLLIGDAACFIDPVFSSGVHLATYSALLAARAVNTSLAGDLAEQECFDEFERRYRREFANFYDFLVAFYDFHQDEDSYFWRARTVLHTEEKGNEAFIRLVAGVANPAEPAFHGAAAYFDHHPHLGRIFQNDPAGEASKAFVDQVFDSMHRMIEHAVAEDHPSNRKSGEPSTALTVSADGLHWERGPGRQAREAQPVAV